MFGEWIRRAVYWSVDFLSGSKVRMQFRDIQRTMEHATDQETIMYQKAFLERILNYAQERVEYYKNIPNGSSLDAFPVVNKNIIKENRGKFLSGEYAERKSIVERHTSGSTGTPFVVRQDIRKKDRVLAEMMYFWSKAGYRIGMRYVFFRIWTDMNRKSRLSAFARNLIMQDILKLSDSNLERIRTRLLNDQKIGMLLGYASTLDNLASYLERHGARPEQFRVQAVISCSELLEEATREKLKKVFGCSIVSLYSNQENGMLAIECRENKEFHLNTASYFFEFLKQDCDEPAEPGELARIVVTDLFNHAMPLIRYDTGDMAVIKADPECTWKTRCVSSIEGRRVDMIYATDGTPLSPHTWSVYMWQFDRLRQYQFIQYDRKTYTLKVNGAKGIYADEELIGMLKNVLGPDADITIEHVDEIPVLSSGKFKKTISLYQPNLLREDI